MFEVDNGRESKLIKVLIKYRKINLLFHVNRSKETLSFISCLHIGIIY